MLVFLAFLYFINALCYRKIMAQRKFAQGVYVPPPSVQIPNRKVLTDLAKDQTNIIRRKTTAKTLLDLVSLES